MVALETLIAYEGGWFYFFNQSGRLRRSKMDEIIDASNPGQMRVLSDESHLDELYSELPHAVIKPEKSPPSSLT